jgi:hypothetical protein
MGGVRGMGNRSIKRNLLSDVVCYLNRTIDFMLKNSFPTRVLQNIVRGSARKSEITKDVEVL